MPIVVPYARRVTLLIIACVATASLAQARVDILQIWQNFVASRVAAEECGGVDKETDTHFLANLLDVRIRAVQAMQERTAGAPTKDEVAVRMTAAEDAIHGKVDDEIKQNGCSSDKVQQLLKLYKMHSTMHF